MPTIVPLIVACALFMQNVDTTVIATSLPAIADSLQEDPIALKLALTSYLLSLAVFIPLSGWMADRYGARNVFRAAIIVFTLGSAACGFATSLTDFVLYRILQGMGGAMMVPVGRLVILRTVSKSELVSALAWLAIPALFGPVIGPPLGGFITTYASWRWIFWVNVPIGILGVALATRYIGDMREHDVPPIDWRGFFLSGISLTTLVSGLATIGQSLLPPQAAVLLLVVGLVTGWLYVRHARTLEAPLLDLKLLSIPTFRASVLGGSLFRVGIGASPFLLPLLFQIGFGLTAFQSGLLTFASAVGVITMKATATRILRRFGFWHVIVVNTIISALFVGANAFFTQATPYAVIIAVLLMGGFFRSLQFTSLGALAFADIEQRHMSRATSFVAVAQQIALSTGVAVAALVLEGALTMRGGTALDVSDFAPAFVIVAGISALSLYFLLALPKDAGAELAGGKVSEQAAPRTAGS